MSDLTVVDVPAQRRFEARDGDDLLGFVEYQRTDELVVVTHTEVPQRHEGRGVGSALARGILDDTRARGLRALVLCPFVIAWMARHPDYQDLDFKAAPRAAAPEDG